jgi:hypothetical protein
MRTGIADLPLHRGTAPRWLFNRMSQLSREIVIAIVEDFGPSELLSRLSDPFWFQSLGCVLGFDWHSSGVTTTVCGALKVGIKGLEKDLNLWVAGGKGRASRRTPLEIRTAAETVSLDEEGLIYASRMAAKVDSSALQDGYQIYHHCFFFDGTGSWAVVQQGMNPDNGFARRYHWLSSGVKDFVREPHAAICAQAIGRPLNLVARESNQARQTLACLSASPPDRLLAALRKLKRLSLPSRHQILLEDIHPDHLKKTLLMTYARQPETFETLLGLSGVGPKTIRALSLISELIHGVRPSFRDPARFAFAHGGKDGHPFPVDRKLYDESIRILRQALDRARLGRLQRAEAIARLSEFAER